MKIKEIKVKSFQDYIKYTKQHSNDNKIRLYRGQEEESWDLDCKLFRLVKERRKIDDFYNIEQEIFSDFKNSLINRVQSKSKQTDWEILAIGQHYGLPTRLIDWTSNSLIALWFSFEKIKSNNNDGVVWGLVVDEWNLVDFNKDKLFGGRFVKVFEPPKIDSRIIAQEAWFSVQNMRLFGNKEGDRLPKFNEYNTMNQMEDFEYHLIRLILPNSLRKEILVELNNRGVNHSSVFPDLSGDCKNIEWRHLE